MTREEAIDVLKRNYPSSCFEDLCEAVDIAIKALSAEPKRKKGHWVGIDDEPCETFECDVCGFILENWVIGATYNFCPTCGSYMGGAEDDQ